MFDVETISFSRQEAASIVGIEDSQLVNWLNRYKPMGDIQRGSGHHLALILTDLFRLAAMKLLTDAGIEPGKAANALKPHSSPYASLLHDRGGSFNRVPGTFVLTLSDEGKLIGVDDPSKPLAIEIRTWPMFDRIFPRMREIAIMRTPVKDADALKAAFDIFERTIEALRRERWGDGAE